ncbi:MAG: extracellular solute-binding protein [Atopostipes suicloacalis]|nr:extracellular solute-binding protein [Atopostipes suicloacalis]
MNKNWKKSWKLGGLAAAALFLAACGNDGVEDTDSTGDAEEVTEDVSLEVALTPQWKGVYDADEEGADYDSFLKEAADLYMEENPNVSIDVQVIPGDQRDSQLSVGLDTNSLPNVFFDSTFALSSWPHQGVTVPLDNVISDDSKEDISDSIWNNVTISDEVYYYPFSQNQGTLVYNADMFEEAGLEDYIGDEEEIISWTTEEFKEILTALKDTNPDIDPLGFFAVNEQGDTWTQMYLRSFGNEFYGEDGKLVANEESGVEALDYILELEEEGLLVDGAESLNSNDVNAMFQNQELAVSFTNSVLYNNMLADMDNDIVDQFDARLANAPAAEGVDPSAFTYIVGSMVFDTEDDAENTVAKDFVKFYSEHEELVEASTNTLPVRSSVSEANSDLPFLEAYNENADNIVNFSNNTAAYSELRSVFYPEIQAALIDEKSAQEALDSFVEKGNDVIERGNEQSFIID